MGKGSGGCARPALPVGASTESSAELGFDHVQRTSGVIRDPESLPQRVRGYVSDEEAGWEPQPDGAALVKELQRHPRQVRAWFLEDSVIKDDVLYFEHRPRLVTTVSQWNLRVMRPARRLACFEPIDAADTDRINDAREELMKSGLSLKTGDEAEIEAELRQRFEGADVEGVIEYVRAHGQVVPITWQTLESADSSLVSHAEVLYDKESAITKALIDAGAQIRPNPAVMNTAAYYQSKFGSGKCLEIQFDDGGIVRYIPHFSVGSKTVIEYENQTVFALSTEELLAVRDAQRTEPQTLDQFVEVASTYKGSDRVRVWHLSELPDDHRQSILDARESGEPREYERNGKGISERVSLPSVEAVIARGWRVTEDGFIRTLKDDGLERLIEQSKTEPVTVDLSWKVRQPAASIDDTQHPADNAPPGFSRRLNAGKLPQALKRYLHDRQPDSRSSKSRVRRDFIPHDAPMSERGQLKMEGMSPERSLQAMQELGLAMAIAPEVPYRALYGDGPRRGRVLPKLDDFYHGSKLTMPDGYMVVHGMTGAYSHAEALSRLDSIIAGGGLHSISERRRMGTTVSSACPDDDTVSRIDQGVPSAITRAPVYGDSVHFVMRPEVLTRRDLWFANCSPAGGEAGYKQYTTYGQSLGQERIWMPCPVDGRQQHLDGLPFMGYNELYLQHSVPWVDIDTVLVAPDLAREVGKRIKKAQRAGLVPASVRVEAVTSSSAASVQSRAQQLGSTVRLTKPGARSKSGRRRSRFLA